MSIDSYASFMLDYFFKGLFLLSVLAGMVAIVMKVRKKTVKCWWLIPCISVYSIVAAYNLFFPYIAYDDVADPNYWKFNNWGLRDFILNDCKMLLLFLVVMLLLYFVGKRKGYLPKAIGWAALGVLAVLSVVVIVFFLVRF